MWMLLMPKEEEALRRPVKGDSSDVMLVEMLQRKLSPGGEIDITPAELNAVKLSLAHHCVGTRRQLEAIVSASDRH